MKKLTAILISAAVLCTSIYMPYAQDNCVNDFMTDSFVWTNGNSGNSNYIKVQDSTDGYADSSAKKIVYDHSEDTWSTYVKMTLPTDWSMDSFNSGAYVHFLARGDNSSETVNAMVLEFTDSDGNFLEKKWFTVEDNSWEHIIIPVHTDLSALASIKITDNMKGSSGTIIIDDFGISVQRPEKRIERKINQLADFEIPQTTISTASTYSGFKNTAGDYSDFISAKAVEGKSGNGLEISYRAATWYSGEVFMNAPAVWDINKDVNAIEFDYKGSGKVKPKLMCDNVIGGSRYETTVTFTDDGEWHHVMLPLSDFKKSGVSVTKEDILGIAFTSAENGGLNNSQDTTKAMSADELLAKARQGSVVIDNVALTNNYEESEPESTPTPEPTPAAESYTIDFDTVKLYAKETWAGFKNNAGDYSDYIKGAMSEEGKSGNGFLIEYSSATYYAGAVFAAPSPEWDSSVDVRYVETDVKGKGSFKIGLETGSVVNGTRYECKLDVDTDGEWKHLCIPISAFNRNGETVAFADVVGIAFSAAENANLSNTSDEVKAMSAEELLSKAKTGSVMIDNLSFVNNTVNKPGINVSAKLYQGTQELKSVKEADDGDITAEAVISNCVTKQPVTAILAVYDSDGRMCGMDIASSDITTEGVLKCEMPVSAADNKSAKMIFVNSLSKIVPISDNIDF